MSEEIKQFQVPATFTSMSNTKDGGKRIGFSTQELSLEEKMALEKFYNGFGWLLFRENEFRPEDLPKEQAEFGGKSQSKRIRNVIWKVLEKKLERKPKDEEFDKFWKEETEKVIEHYKKLL